MPRRIIPRRPRRPRFGRRRRTRKRVVNLWPRSKLVKVSVVNTSTFSANGGAMGGVVMKANSLNDPTGVAGAGLPLGIDQLSNLYKKYTVVKSSISVVGHPITITGAVNHGVHLTDNSSLLTDQDHYKELPLNSSRMVSPDIDIFKVGMSYRPKKFWHLKTIRDNDEQKASLIGSGSVGAPAPADPTNIAYYHVWLQDANKTDNIATEVSVRITYWLLLTDPVSPARSSL